jgi:signal transduction histidine kinase
LISPSTRTHQKRSKNPGAERDVILAFISHELRTPVTAILGWAKLVKDKSADHETVLHGLEVIERNASVLTRLIGQLLDFSRARNGGLRSTGRKTSLVIVLEEAIDTMMALAQAKEIDLRLSLEASTCEVVGDPICLHQLLTNLLSNAIKFTPATGRIDIRHARFGSWAEVTVSDTGRGIRPDFLPYIFDPFKQENSSRASIDDGLGLGLAIARQIVEDHGGDIKAVSPGEGKGTTFTVRLPIPDHEVAADLKFS